MKKEINQLVYDVLKKKNEKIIKIFENFSNICTFINNQFLLKLKENKNSKFYLEKKLKKNKKIEKVLNKEII